MKIHLGEPVVIARCPDVSRKGQVPWGAYQFPAIQTTAEGFLHVNFHISADSVRAYGNPVGHAVSRDGGNSWRLCEKDAGYTDGLALADGGRIRACNLPSVDPATLSLPDRPDATMPLWSDEGRAYYANRFDGQSNGWSVERKTRGGDWAQEILPAALPADAARYIAEGMMPHNMLWRLRSAPDKTVWGISYVFFINGYGSKTVLQPVFLIGGDRCESFRFLSTIPYQPLPAADSQYAERAGFTEPDVAFLPDGSVFCVMRTNDRLGNGPTYSCRSVDGGATWSRPAFFDTLGVWPSLLTLECGVTLVSYGRPGIYLRATSDPSGLRWEEPTCLLDADTESCCYTEMAATGANSAVLVYSQFTYPDENGVTHKTILSRTLEVV